MFRYDKVAPNPISLILMYIKVHFFTMCLLVSAQNICTRVCSAKSDWIQSVKNPTVSDFMAQQKDMAETLQPVLSKLSAQCNYQYDC